MIKELADFGKRIRTGHDALKNEPIDIDLVIDEDGNFIQFSVIERIFRPAEALTAKKGKARLLLDKPEEVLEYLNKEFSDKKNKLIKEGKNEEQANYLAEIEAKKSVGSKHHLFLEKINEYRNLDILKPVLRFYYENKENGICKALDAFESQVSEKERNGNIAFRVKDIRLHEQQEVYDAVIQHYENKQSEKLKKETKKCSICGKTSYPISEGPHGMIKNVPDGKPSGSALVSYNEDAYESYNLKGNLNSSICTNCAKNYVEGLNYLMSNGQENLVESKKGKVEKKFVFTNRKNLGTDTAVVFWTREPEQLNELDWFDHPDPGQVSNLIESVASTKINLANNFKSNKFYSITLSGVDSRIAVRDWIEISLEKYRQNIAYWFKDIGIKYYNHDAKELTLFYPSINQLAWSCNREKLENDPTSSRVAKHLWSCALKNQKPPLWILAIVLKRIAHNKVSEEGKTINTFTESRASLIKFILNRNNKGGIPMVKEELDLENKTPAYLCGRLFALIEGIQRSALGKNINAGVRERFFAAASSSPAPAFGRLMRLMQNHLSKLKQEKPGLAINLDKEVTDLCGLIDQFPAILSLEQQGQFALGYYHQKQFNFARAKQNKEFESLTENMEEQNYE
ncbi:MAG: type I-C CRISPR-associated protein Cas8c/Csd1 [Bacteroidales bacterium]